MGKMGGKREGAGRPRVVGGKKSVPMNITVSDAQAAAIDREAIAEATSRGGVVRNIISDWLTERKQSVTLPSAPAGGQNGSKKGNA